VHVYTVQCASVDDRDVDVDNDDMEVFDDDVSGDNEQVPVVRRPIAQSYMITRPHNDTARPFTTDAAAAASWLPQPPLTAGDGMLQSDYTTAFSSMV